MVANDKFYSSAIENTLLALALSFFVILLVTGNWMVTLITEITLIAIVSSCFAMIATLGPNFDEDTRKPYNGWDLDFLVSIDITVAAGMAVDYCLHLSHSYMHQHGTREERTRKTLGEMGGSVFQGMLTTMFALMPLFLTGFLFFSRFGFFGMCLISSSWVISNLGLMSALATFGPADGQGDIAVS